ncbi:MAG TPA: DUF255 domain-containing protein [candidate division Zixibacteria bacterium]|nr:DUF255 domain-containing protein [candidate division Zixibacteria bacterium]
MCKPLIKYFLIGSLVLALSIFAESEWKWLDFAEAHPLAIEEGKPLLVNFYSTGCYWCRKLDADTFGDSLIESRLHESFIATRVNIASNRKVQWREQTITEHDLARHFSVRGTPLTAFVDTTGKIVGSIPGYIPPENFLPMLKYVEGGWYNELSFQEFLVSEEALKKN